MRFAVALACVLAASVAFANGRGPLTNGITFKPGDAHSLYMRSTFGLFISHDDGCTFNWFCEDNVGYGGSFDPRIAVNAAGTIFATSPTRGLRVSKNDGCSFDAAAGVPADAWTDGLDIGPTGEVWVTTATTAQPNDVFASTDGVTFSARGMLSPTIWWKSVRVAPSNPMRIYLGGYEVAGTLPDGGMAPLAHLAHSDDDGAHWTPSPLTGVQYGSTPVLLIAAVDRTNPDVAYIVSQGANSPTGDLLYRTSDAGQTLTQVLAAGGTITDVVIKDSQNVMVTTLVMNGMSFIGGPAYRSTDGGGSFPQIANAPQLACLALRSDGVLLGCAANWTPDFMALGTSADNGATWQKVWRFVEMNGAGGCATGTTEQDVCNEQQWPNLQTQFAPTGPACGSNAHEGALDGPPAPPPKKKGCCDAGGSGAGSLAWAGFVAIWLRRKKSR
jgi:hypothetical protein